MKKIINESIIAGTDEAKIEFDGKVLYASVEFVGEKAASHLSDDHIDFDASQHNVLTLSLGEDGKSVEFDAWGSKMHPSLEDEPEATTSMIMRDAISYLDCDSVDDFCNMFGYELYDEYGETNTKAEEIFDMCGQAVEKLNSIGLTEDDIYLISDILNEKENDGTLDTEEDEDESDDEVESLDESTLKCFNKVFKNFNEARSTGLFYVVVNRNGKERVYQPNNKNIRHGYDDAVALKKELEAKFKDCTFRIARENDEVVKAETDGMDV